jgi:tetratricopeptide (TPR) repeat protein/S1-C subfamily serine protease
MQFERKNGLTISPRGFVKFFPLPFVFLSVLFFLPSFGVAEVTLSSGSMDTIGAAVFEVVVPKPVKDSLTYKEPLPFNNLPYAVRNDRYVSIGTAFAIGPDLFVTAAHVMNLGVESQWEEPLLRDRNGRLYRVDTIIKFSQRRDFVVFTVKQGKLRTYFRTNREPRLNQRVFAVGNALGEGVVIRDGLFTSATPEEEEGAWKWIRFSAAASPGNSGGPLLDGAGRVIGIVLKKSPNENLNVALPIAEVMNARENMAHLYEKSWFSLPISGRYKGRTGGTFLQLPQSYRQLKRTVVEYSNTTFHSVAKEYFREEMKRLFPNGSGSKALVAAPPTGVFPSLARMKDDGYWEAQNVTTTSVELGQNGGIVYGELGGSLAFTLRRPDNVSLAQLFSDGKFSMDLVLRGLNFSRNVGESPIRITSFGPPLEQYRFRDYYGRIWLVRTWLREYDDTKVVTFSLPTPEGLVTLMRIGQTGVVDVFHVPTLKILTNFIFCSYAGTLKEWEDFLRYRDLLPEAVSSFTISRHGSGVSFATPRLATEIGDGIFPLTDKSLLALLMGYGFDKNAVTWDVSSFLLMEDRSESALLSISRYPKPDKELNEEFHRFWENLSAGTFPYDRSAYAVDGSTRIMTVVEANRNSASPLLHTLLFMTKGNVPQDAMADKLDRIQRGVTVKEHGTVGVTGSAAATVQLPYTDYCRIMQEDTGSALRYAFQGHIHLERDDIDRARRNFDRALALDPHCSEAYVGMGMLYAKRAEYERALGEYGKAIQFNPFNAEAFNNRGYVFSALGQYDKAITEFGRALEINPHLMIAYNNRARSYTDIRNYDRALADRNRFLEINPNSYEGYFNRGTLYRLMGDYEKALADFDRAVQIDGTLPPVYLGRAFLHEQRKEVDRAVKDYSSAIELDGKLVEAYFNRGKLYMRNKELSKAIDDFSRVISLDPTMSGAYVQRGMALSDTGDRGRALNDYSVALKINLDNVDALALRGFINASEGDTQVALDDLNRALSLAPNNWYALFGRGIAYGRRGVLELSLADFNRAAILEPKNADIYISRGFTFFLKKEMTAALGDYNRALEINPKAPRAYQNRGNLHAYRRDMPNACSDWKRACELGACVNFMKAQGQGSCR